jgi:dipeptidase E
MRLLLFSNSTNAGENYLEYTKNYIREFLGVNPYKLVFIPFAGVTISSESYTKRVKEIFSSIGYTIQSIEDFDEYGKAIEAAEGIVVGGGNTFQLLKKLQTYNLLEPIRKKVLAGTPYIGWSAGSNLTCPTIKTTNDMPIAEPANFNALNLVPFQINPHYTDKNPEGHAGETREMRIEEFIEVNQDIYVIGLREGTLLKVENENLHLLGDKPARIFKKQQAPVELTSSENFRFLLKK